jgi:hypothetical protein
MIGQFQSDQALAKASILALYLQLMNYAMDWCETPIIDQ